MTNLSTNWDMANSYQRLERTVASCLLSVTNTGKRDKDIFEKKMNKNVWVIQSYQFTDNLADHMWFRN